MIFGKILKDLRKEKNKTQVELSKIFNVSKTTICQWETSKQEPSLTDIVKMAKYFNVSVDYLLGLEEIDGRKIESKTYNINNNFNFK